MIGDIWTMIWKEWRELIRIHRMQSKIGFLILIPVGVMLYFSVVPNLNPAQLKSALILFFVGIFSLMPVTSIIADSIAGERERHTLETLVSTRLPDMAILLGKMLAAVLYGWALGMIAPICLWIAINIKFMSTGPHSFSPVVAMGAPVVGLLMASLGAGLGLLISLRSQTVKQASATLMVYMMGIMMLPNILMIALPAEPRTRVINWAKELNPNKAVFLIVLVLLILDLWILSISIFKFDRARMITRT